MSVIIKKCNSYNIDAVDSAVKDIFAMAGGIESFEPRGKNVLIKPNLLMARNPDMATTAHPSVVEAVARQLVEAGARVTIADSPGGPYNRRIMERVYSACGMTRVAENTGAELNWDFTSQTVNRGGRSLEVISPAVTADLIINISKLKTHSMMYFTGAVKNLFGTMPGITKGAMHARYPYPDRFGEMLVDVCLASMPAFSIIDGIEGMEGKGPSGGTVRKADVLIASRSPFEADFYAMNLCGLDPQKSPVHVSAVKRGLVAKELSGIELLGDAGHKIGRPFEPAVITQTPWNFFIRIPGVYRWLKNRRMPYPKFTSKCVGCGDCAAVCPKKALRMEDGRPRLEKRECIKCYCCHELCPVTAIDLGEG